MSVAEIAHFIAIFILFDHSTVLCLAKEYGARGISIPQMLILTIILIESDF